MALDKLVDSGKLDAALEATADAIRVKTGGTAEIAFDLDGGDGFADAVEAIPTGGGASDHYAVFTLTADVAGTDTVVHTLTGDALTHKDDSTFALMIHAISPPTNAVAVVGGCIANELLGEKTDGTAYSYGYTVWYSNSTGKPSAVNITHPVNNQSGTFTSDFWVASDGKVYIKGSSTYKWKAGTYIIAMGW